jgi:CDP-glucose 4,6-dehydratase
VNPNFWSGKRVLLTGHTGFKGSWLSLWLQSMGADLAGLALPPPTIPSLFLTARVAEGMTSHDGDIRNFEPVHAVMLNFRPDVVIHMAAQPLVLYSYNNPIETYATNVLGTVHVLEATRQVGSARVVVNVTTDKCYENIDSIWGYREDDRMGGYDPYSSSKGCSELATDAFRRSYFQQKGVGIASARAGNVIGGGDWSENRLIPDILDAFGRGQPARIRNPSSTRPWQHVLEPLAGYLTLAEKLWQQPEMYSGGWNFGPKDKDVEPVKSLVERVAKHWGPGATWEVDNKEQAHEAKYLKLDISKAKQYLDWHPRWNIDKALSKTVDWYKAWLAKEDVNTLCIEQINEYMNEKNQDE